MDVLPENSTWNAGFRSTTPTRIVTIDPETPDSMDYTMENTGPSTRRQSIVDDPFEKYRRTERQPSLVKAARQFQDNIRSRADSKLRAASDRNGNLERELTALQSKMDQKMGELEGLQEMSDQTAKPAAHILETVMGELEQRNLELSSLLKQSERSRVEMEDVLKEQNEELTTLRANTLIMKTLEEEVTLLTSKKDDLNERVSDLETELHERQLHEQMLNQKLSDCEHERQSMEQDNASRRTEMGSKLSYAQQQIKEKELLVENTEITVKELFEKCNQLGTSNSEVKQELLHCLESGKRLKDLNTKLHFCKDYLEQQVDQLIKDLKASRGTNEQLKLEMSNGNRERQNYHKQVLLLEEQHKQTVSEMHIMKEKLSSVEKQLHEYESGSIRSACVIAEINKEKDSKELLKLSLEKQVRDLEGELKLKEEELRASEMFGRKLKSDLVQCHAKVEYYQESFIEKQELQKLRADLEIKYKLDLNTQLQRVGDMFEKEQNELIETMKTSLNARSEPEMYHTAVTPEALRLRDFYRAHT
ncbi:paramyosin-like [Clytia hemisphaerica]|uniref:Uncharacterized protein n=1 Tax=Clytia hemisphaerica TaxID=252671 RepID=A0A7M5UVV8_9CNID